MCDWIGNSNYDFKIKNHTLIQLSGQYNNKCANVVMSIKIYKY